MGNLFTAVFTAFALIPALASAASPGDQAFEALQDRLESQPVLRADFRQVRHLKLLKRPLESRGKMLLLEDEGVLWRITEPYEVTYLIRADEVLEWEGAEGPRRVPVASVPAFRLMTEMFLAALSGDLSGLREGFQAESMPAETGWRLRLRPTSEALAEILAGLEMAGDRHVEDVVIEEAKGDSLHFLFSNFDPDPAGPDAAERSYFAH